MAIGIIGGTGMTALVEDLGPSDVETSRGRVHLQKGHLPSGIEVVFLARHGPGHQTPPHRIDHVANLEALKAAGCDAVLAVNNTGGLHADLVPGSVLVPDDFVDLTGPSWTTFDDEAVHIDVTEPYCPHLRQALLAGLREADWPKDAVRDGGIYVQTKGPRLETRAEVRHLATLGDVAGMTGAPEAVIARELGLCYASVCFVANPGAGVEAAPLTAIGIRDALRERSADLGRALAAAVGHVLEVRDCRCMDATGPARLTEPDSIWEKG